MQWLSIMELFIAVEVLIKMPQNKRNSDIFVCSEYKVPADRPFINYPS